MRILMRNARNCSVLANNGSSIVVVDFNFQQP